MTIAIGAVPGCGARCVIAGAVQLAPTVGHRAEQIVRHADLAIVGHRGQTFFERRLTGSVAERVVDYAPCAVLVAR